MTNLEIDIICSRLLLFLKYCSRPVIAWFFFFTTYPVHVGLEFGTVEGTLALMPRRYEAHFDPLQKNYQSTRFKWYFKA